MPVTPTLMGLGCFPVRPRAVSRHARHARHVHRQHGDGQGRPHRLDRRTLRRSRHRQARRVRPSTPRSFTSTSIRRREQERQGRSPHRRRRQDRSLQQMLDVLPPSAARRRATEWWNTLREWQKRFPSGATARRQTSSCRKRSCRAHRVTEGEASARPTSGQHQMWAAQYYPAKHGRSVAHLRRSRHDGLRPPGRDGRRHVGNPGRHGDLITGDGSFQMCSRSSPPACTRTSTSKSSS